MSEIKHPAIIDGIERLRTVWPQSFAERNKYGHHMIVVPGVLLPKAFEQNICTVLFIAPPGYPAACPDHFFTDIEIRHAESHKIPRYTNMGNGAYLEQLGWPQWKHSQWWSWHLQMWSPNHGSLFTYMKVIQQRFNTERASR
jgi:hypothetical protein